MHTNGVIVITAKLMNVKKCTYHLALLVIEDVLVVVAIVLNHMLNHLARSVLHQELIFRIEDL